MSRILPDDLTNRDMDIMNVLWESSESMTASQIVEAGGTVLCRSYLPAITADEFSLSHFNQEYLKMQEHISLTTLIACLLDNTKDTELLQKNIYDLQALLKEYQKKIDSAKG